MDIVFSANNFEESIKLPVVPPSLEISQPRKNEEFETIQMGTLNLLGLKGLRTLSIQSFFPMRNYPFIKDKRNGWDYVNFFNKWSDKRVPIRIIITDKAGKEVLNMPCTVENFTYGLDRIGDIQYTLEIKEFRFVEVR
ncbi:hypothetical protein HNQ80_004319 [Anaerosolibacter carboniphilus]|uniref:Uncharacterized protein n=1 Tax=Anaerosolibacter carboniphilus TaxID=1417629 RepID=A0A841L706_9FIRM|nr:phage portal protein [Anaerosolibacter carboniphilus]MBB6218179.1 hypothetical protein [Anaerosolibacter carboniphilus]